MLPHPTLLTCVTKKLHSKLESANFNSELRSSINAKFDKLPLELAVKEAMRNLKEDILKLIKKR